MDNPTINDVKTMAGGEASLLAGRYRVVRQLGQGGMGSVWLAEDVELENRKVAVKMLPAILVANKRALRQLKSEAMVSMRLVHPNIVQVRSFEENGGNAFLVSDYVEGQTLDDLLAEKETLSEEEAIRLLRPVADALDYAHGEGVVHRDVKPSNIMIRTDGRPFILDFGIAREIQETMTRVTGKLSSGTLLYMSPEQLHGSLPSAAQDVYSFSAMVYECLTGHPPFHRGQIEYQIEHDVPEPLGLEFANLGPVVMAGLAKRPEERPASCVAVFPSVGGGNGVTVPARTKAEETLGGVQLWKNGPYWAECNVGALKPEEYGYYFWWGDTVGYKCNEKHDGWVSVKDETPFAFRKSTWFRKGTCPTYGKNHSWLQSADYIDLVGNLTAAHDAATVHLGAPWRMPTARDFADLELKCTTRWATLKSVYGRLVTGKGDYSSKSIFLPAAGYGDGSSLNASGSYCGYWSSTPYLNSLNFAWYLYFISGSFGRSDGSRFYGLSIRPVRGSAK